MQDIHTLNQLCVEAQQALAMGRADLAEPMLARLASVIPGHQTVLTLQQWAAIIGFKVPLERHSYTPAVRSSPDQANIELVSFHVNLRAAPSGFHQGFDYLDVQRQSFESAMLRAPRARRVLITDEHTDVPADMPVHEIRRYAINTDRLMYERMRVQRQYLAERPAGMHTIFIDSDVVVNREPSSVFASDFDIGLTWRANFIDAPFNGGIIFVSGGEAGERFFTRALATYDAIAKDPNVGRLFSKDLRSWWGDQFALALVAGYREFAERSTDGVEVEGVKLRYFPCSTFNFTMEGNTNYSPQFLAERYFVHFKGNRKVMQAQYLNFLREGKV